MGLRAKETHWAARVTEDFNLGIETSSFKIKHEYVYHKGMGNISHGLFVLDAILYFEIVWKIKNPLFWSLFIWLLNKTKTFKLILIKSFN